MSDPPVGTLGPATGLSESELAAVMSGENGAFVEALFEDYVTGRDAVPSSWAEFFDALMGRSGNGSGSNGARAAALPSVTGPPAAQRNLSSDTQTGVFGLVDAFRSHGHLIARLDPLGGGERVHALLDPAEFGLQRDMQHRVGVGNYLGLEDGTAAELIDSLHETYCGTFAVEFMEIRDKERRDWLIERMEPIRNRPHLPDAERRRIFEQLLAAERFEQFLHKRFLGQKRFSLEGGESLIPLMDAIIEDAAEYGAEELVVAMAHRGRLSFMAHTQGMPYRSICAGFQPSLLPLDAQGSGDVKYHRGYSTDRILRSGKRIHISLCPNPSHLEWINPVAEGMVRAKQNIRGDSERKAVIPLQIHGDSAFTGQGIVPETLALSELDSHWTGGTVHIIVNNQIGFTTEPKDYRFTRHPSDMAKVIQAPIFHVNADDPEACVHAARLAISFRQRFREDVIIDLVCYRRYGHNEGDDPTFTQPLLYKSIGAHPRVGTLYGERLIEEGALDRAAWEEFEEAQRQRLEQGMEQSTVATRLEGAEGYHGLWSDFESNGRQENGRTSIEPEVVESIGRALTSFPENFHPHPKIHRLMEQRSKRLLEHGLIDWGMGEALAFGSLLIEGVTIRAIGQDVERGTFSHRHAVLHDIENGESCIPLESLSTGDARFIIVNSMLSEAAVLGFEYGYSTVDPNRLVIWEAQFGDFSNSAQVIIDQFISSAEQKWNRSSGLVMLLPHGMEGQGPEHSSARLERFLQLCAEDNLQICNLTTPAQLFHALRRQLRRNFRKPLIVMSPKSLLRHPEAVSSCREVEEGKFEEVLDDPRTAAGELDPAAVRRVIVCSGKVYYTLLAARRDAAFDDVALIRLEELHPFPFSRMRETLQKYETRDFVWVQEEPWNQGAWSFLRERLPDVLPKGGRLRYVGRLEAASPATGSYRKHEEEEKDFVREAFARRARTKRRG